MISLTFISNGLQLLDVPHLLISTFKRYKHNKEQKKYDVKQPFIDEYAFDIGYHHAYSTAIFTLGLSFCTIVPLISFFGFTFFFLKYYIDKYNLTFVYNKEFEAGGAIKSKVIPYILAGIFIFQILNTGFYAFKFSSDYLAGGLSLILIETTFIMFVKVFYEKRKR